MRWVVKLISVNVHQVLDITIVHDEQLFWYLPISTSCETSQFYVMSSCVDICQYSPVGLGTSPLYIMSSCVDIAIFTSRVWDITFV